MANKQNNKNNFLTITAPNKITLRIPCANVMKINDYYEVTID